MYTKQFPINLNSNQTSAVLSAHDQELAANYEEHQSFATDFAGDTAPQFPVINGRWLDTSTTPPILKRWNSLAWVNEYIDHATNADSATNAGACTGNSATATKLATARKINGVDFDGSADIDFDNIGVVFGDVYLHAGCVKANGATVNRADYPRLVALADTYSLWTADTANNLGLFGNGNGTTTMVLPNWTDRVAQFASTGGGTVAAGLPNITGSLGTTFGDVAWLGWDAVGGAFSAGTSVTNAIKPTVGSTYTGNAKVDFDASYSNGVYGGSTTVQPSAIKVIPQMKY